MQCLQNRMAAGNLPRSLAHLQPHIVSPPLQAHDLHEQLVQEGVIREVLGGSQGSLLPLPSLPGECRRHCCPCRRRPAGQCAAAAGSATPVPSTHFTNMCFSAVQMLVLCQWWSSTPTGWA